jgi:hypothetical protein
MVDKIVVIGHPTIPPSWLPTPLTIIADVD